MTAVPSRRTHLTESAVEAEREAQQRRVEHDISAHQAAERRARLSAIVDRKTTRSTPPPARDMTAAPNSTGARIAAQVLGHQAESPDPLRDPNPAVPSAGKMMGRPPSATEREQTRRQREAALKALEGRVA